MPAKGEEIERYDAIIVGGGVIGLACAWRAAQRGLSVCVLERGEPGAGASTVAAGGPAPPAEGGAGGGGGAGLDPSAPRPGAPVAAGVRGGAGRPRPSHPL